MTFKENPHIICFEFDSDSPVVKFRILLLFVHNSAPDKEDFTFSFDIVRLK